MVHRRLGSDYAEDARAFGEAVRARREELGWSRKKLVEVMEHQVNEKTVERIELGHSNDDLRSPANPELRVLLELGKALKASVRIDYNRPSGFAIELVTSGPNPNGSDRA